jgi:heme/copper-type cytochrome/quinol oxidase subunit 2
MALYIQDYVEFLYLGLIFVYLTFFVVFYRFTSRSGPRAGGEEGSVQKGMDRKEKAWLVALLIVAVVGNGIVLSPLLPSAVMGLYPPTPSRSVNISIENYTFHLPEDPIVIKVGEPVVFHVTSADVTYGFGVFRQDGTLVCQMQVLPGYDNHLEWAFDQPGFYTIRGTEYAGPGTPYMVLNDSIEVVE